MSLINPMGGRMAMLDLLQRRRQMDQAAVGSVADPLGQAATEINRGVGQQISLQDLAIRQAEEARRKQAEYERLQGIASEEILGALMAENAAAMEPRARQQDADVDNEDILALDEGDVSGLDVDLDGGARSPSRSTSNAATSVPPAGVRGSDFEHFQQPYEARARLQDPFGLGRGGAADGQGGSGGSAVDEQGRQVGLEGARLVGRQPGQQAQQAGAGFPNVLPPHLRAGASPMLEPELPPPLVYELAERYKKEMAGKGFSVDKNAAMSAAQSAISKMRIAYENNAKARMAEYDAARKRAIEDLDANASQAIRESDWNLKKQQLENNLPTNFGPAYARLSNAIDDAYNVMNGGVPADTAQQREVENISALAKQIGADLSTDDGREKVRREMHYRISRMMEKGLISDEFMGNPHRFMLDGILNDQDEEDVKGEKVKDMWKGVPPTQEIRDFYGASAIYDTALELQAVIPYTDSGYAKNAFQTAMAYFGVEGRSISLASAQGQQVLRVLLSIVSGKQVTDKEAAAYARMYGTPSLDEDTWAQQTGLMASRIREMGENAAMGMTAHTRDNRLPDSYVRQFPAAFNSDRRLRAGVSGPSPRWRDSRGGSSMLAKEVAMAVSKNIIKSGRPVAMVGFRWDDDSGGWVAVEKKVMTPEDAAIMLSGRRDKNSKLYWRPIELDIMQPNPAAVDAAGGAAGGNQ